MNYSVEDSEGHLVDIGPPNLPKMEITKVEVRLLRWIILTIVVKHWRES